MGPTISWVPLFGYALFQLPEKQTLPSTNYTTNVISSHADPKSRHAEVALNNNNVLKTVIKTSKNNSYSSWENKSQGDFKRVRCGTGMFGKIQLQNNNVKYCLFVLN